MVDIYKEKWGQLCSLDSLLNLFSIFPFLPFIRGGGSRGGTKENEQKR